jgi:hypothetical protein
MNGKNSITRWIAVVLFGVAAVALGQTETQTITDEQKAKFEKTDIYIEQQRQKINDDYANQLDEIRAKKANELLRLENINPDLYVRGGFFGWAGYVQNVLDLGGIDLFEDSQFAETFRDLRDNGRGLTTVEQLDLTPRLLAIAMDRFAAEKSRALRGFNAAERQLEQERISALNIHLSRYNEQVRYVELNPPQAKPSGMISGILYSADKPAAIVGPKIVYQGDKLGNVQAVKIDRDTVEFDKSGKTWKQKVGEAPSSSLWQ